MLRTIKCSKCLSNINSSLTIGNNSNQISSSLLHLTQINIKAPVHNRCHMISKDPHYHNLLVVHHIQSGLPTALHHKRLISLRPTRMKSSRRESSSWSTSMTFPSTNSIKLMVIKFVILTKKRKQQDLNRQIWIWTKQKTLA